MIYFRRIMAILVASVYGCVSFIALIFSIAAAAGASSSDTPGGVYFVSIFVLVLFGIPWIFIFKWFKRIFSDLKRIRESLSSKKVCESKSSDKAVSHHLVYKDSSGTISERDICFLGMKNNNLFDAFCFMRNDYRTFRIDRIIELIDVQTGEVVCSNKNN